MSVHFYWYVPTNGDGEYLGLNEPQRKPTLDYIVNVAKAAEEAGFEGVLIPTGIPYLDSWIVGSAIIHHTRTIKPLIAFRQDSLLLRLPQKWPRPLTNSRKGECLSM